MTNNLAIISQRFNAMKRQLIPKVGAVMLEFTSDRFREQGWKDETLNPWAKRKNNADPGRGILIGKGTAHLSRSSRVIDTTDHSVTIGSDLPYAKAHNDGFTGTVTVPAHTRKRLQKSKIVTDKLTKRGKPKKQTVLKPIGDIDIKAYNMHMNIPQRKFMGNSAALKKQIRDLITEEVNKCFK